MEHQDQVVSRDQVAHQVQQELMAPKGHQEQADLKELLAIKDRVELRVQQESPVPKAPAEQVDRQELQDRPEEVAQQG